MEYNIKIPEPKYSNIFHKMLFIYNALENGWQITKKADKYIFIKNGETNNDVYLDNYLQLFIEQNLNSTIHINNIN